MYEAENPSRVTLWSARNLTVITLPIVVMVGGSRVPQYLSKSQQIGSYQLTLKGVSAERLMAQLNHHDHVASVWDTDTKSKCRSS